MARQFAMDGWQVAFISLPITPFHLFSKNSTTIKRKYQNSKSGGFRYEIGQGSIWSFVPWAMLIPQNNHFMRSLIYQNWHRLLHPRYQRLLRRYGFDDVDLIYIRDPLQAYILDLIQYKYSIYRMADNDSGFDNYNKYYADLERSVAQKVDLVLYTAMELKDRVHDLRPRQSMLFPNGVDLQHFINADKSMPPEYQDIPTPIVVYAGSIDFWFDFDLINSLTKALPDVTFVLIGPNGHLSRKFIPRRNLHHLGSIQYDQLPKYLSNATIGIIPFNVGKFPDLVNSINPIKLYEYLSCGLPVVATRWAELVNLQSPATLCSTTEEFITAIRSIRAERSEKQSYLEFVERYNWEQLYKQLMAEIKISG